MTTDEEDHLLMQRIAQRDSEAYRLLVEKYLSMCVRFAERMVGNRQDAEDIAQDTCVKLWKHPERWQQQARFSTWLYRVVWNACIDYHRRLRRFSDADLDLVIDDTPGADTVLIQHQQAQQVGALLQQLPPRQRAALVLCYYEELSNQEAASALGIPLGALQQLLFRARQNMKLLLTTTHTIHSLENSHE